jgi:hypothetical protein
MIQHEEVPGVTDTMIKTKIRNSYSSKSMMYEPQPSSCR